MKHVGDPRRPARVRPVVEGERDAAPDRRLAWDQPLALDSPDRRRAMQRGSPPPVVAVALRPVAAVDRPCAPSSKSRLPSRSASRDQCAGGRSIGAPPARRLRFSPVTTDRPSASAASPAAASARMWTRSLPGGSAETVLPGALAELPRGGDALFSPLAGGANEGGPPELACAGVAGRACWAVVERCRPRCSARSTMCRPRRFRRRILRLRPRRRRRSPWRCFAPGSSHCGRTPGPERSAMC